MAPSIFQRFFPCETHHIQGLNHELTRRIPVKGRVLDLGCGSNSDLARYRSNQLEVWGTDLQKHPQLQYPQWFRLLDSNGRIPFPDGYFDVVSTIMVLEHVKNPKDFFLEIRRALRPNGVFIGHSISGQHYVTWIRRFIGLLPHSVNQAIVHRLYGRSPEDTFPTYYRINRHPQILRNCQVTGLKLLSIQHYADPSYFRFSSLLESTAIVCDWLLEKIGPDWGRLYFTVTLQNPGETKINAA